MRTVVFKGPYLNIVPITTMFNGHEDTTLVDCTD